MEDFLSNPPWFALCTGNKNLALGDNDVKYFDADVSPFVALRENTPEYFEKLATLLSRETPSLLFTTVETNVPAPWKVLRTIPGYQMVHNGQQATGINESNIVPLAAEQIPQMLKLTELTKPGPFAVRTIEFGHYTGIFEGDQLAAMAGQRLHPGHYAEISAVCTHPDHTGKGYARQLLGWQANRIITAGEVPMLHVAASNSRAIGVYESLGFSISRPVWFYVFIKRKG